MIRLLKFLKKTDWVILAFVVALIGFNVWVELEIFEYMQKITQIIFNGGTNAEILRCGLSMVICALISALGAVVVNFFVSKIAANLGSRIRLGVYDKVMNFSTAEIKHFQTASLITRSTNDVTQVQTLFSMGVRMLVRAPIMAIMAILKIVKADIAWTAATIIAVAFIALTLAVIVAFAMPRFKKIQSLQDKFNTVTRESLTGARVVRSFNAEGYQEDKFEKVNNEFYGNDMAISRAMCFLDPAMSLIMNGLPLAIYVIGAILIAGAGIADKIILFSNMTVFSGYAIQVVMSFVMLISIFIMIPRAQVSANRICEVLKMPSSIEDGSGINQPIKEGEVQFVNVGFKYPDAEEYVLHNINFKAEKGQMVAFIGSTGSGKSTLINLIPRLYDATEGQVIVDGVNVKDYKQSELNDKIGYISQKAMIFSGTVRSNVTMGNKAGEKPTDDDIKNALEISQSDFVNKLSGGLDAEIHQGGKNISGGQKQRLSIARALARKPEILIFDDSFSALDYKTDKKLRAALKKRAKGVTCMVVAQRIGTIIDADKILVLDNGNVVGEGTHSELIKNCKVYKEIALSQLSKEELQNA